ncbi:type II secretion system protein [Noviherbaspirillum sp. ST9]|uniref:type II secretion system protein n=1 Tax=Noviherbaspirillum sp. ST9 TaxID=3401606 RepID=UPI003B587EE5
MHMRSLRTGGFTMVEAIIVISILGIVGAMIAVFIRMPMEGYDSASRRAEMTDIADTALRRISRDLRLSVPNSVRVATDGTSIFLGFLPVVTGGMYRAECSTVAACTTGAEHNLDFSTTVTQFDVLGGLPVQPAIGQSVVIFNLGVPGADAYSGDNTATITAVNTTSTGGSLSIAATRPFPFASPNQRFQVFGAPVTYVCTPATVDNAGRLTGTGTLTRVTGYAIGANQPTSFSGAGIQTSVLATRVSGCAITPPENMTLPGLALVTIRLTLLSNGESVSLYHEAHINNVP